MDALGRTATRTQGGSSTSYSYDRTSNDATTITQGSVATQIVRDATSTPRSSKTGTAVSALIQNVHGDTSIFKSSTGTISGTALYDAFGQATTTGTAAAPLGFQSMLTDSVSGLVDMSARDYDPAAGSFTSEDTVVGDLTSPVSLNRYTYGSASPLDHFDADGHLSLPIPLPKVVTSALSGVGKATSWVVSGVARVGQAALGQVASLGRSALSTAQDYVGRGAQAVSTAARAVQSTTASALSRAAGPSMRQSFSAAVSSLTKNISSDDVHLTLAAAGLVPGLGTISGAADGLLYLMQGDTKNALIAFAVMVPVAGGVVAGARALGRIDRASELMRFSEAFGAALKEPRMAALDSAANVGKTDMRALPSGRKLAAEWGRIRTGTAA